VHFSLAAPASTLIVPANALLFRSQGVLAAVVSRDQRVHLKRLTQGRDFGTSIEVLSGLDPGDDVVLNPPDSITEGMQVRVVHSSAPPTATGPTAPRQPPVTR